MNTSKQKVSVLSYQENMDRNLLVTFPFSTRLLGYLRVKLTQGKTLWVGLACNTVIQLSITCRKVRVTTSSWLFSLPILGILYSSLYLSALSCSIKCWIRAGLGLGCFQEVLSTGFIAVLIIGCHKVSAFLSSLHSFCIHYVKHILL